MHLKLFSTYSQCPVILLHYYTTSPQVRQSSRERWKTCSVQLARTISYIFGKRKRSEKILIFLQNQAITALLHHTGVKIMIILTQCKAMLL